jgi:hypothetical protein
LALTCSLELPAMAQASDFLAPPAGVDAKARALSASGQHVAAAREWEAALAAVPETLEVRAERNRWVTGAVNEYYAVFEADRSQCDALLSSLRLADEYLRSLIAVYSQPAQNADDYVAMRGLRDELERARVEAGCPEPTAAPVPAPSPAATLGGTQPEPVAAVPIGPGDADAGPQRERRRGSPGLAAGIGVSAALGVAMLATSVALYLPLRKTAKSGAYREIYELAEEKGVANDAESDMCNPQINMGDADIEAACDTWQQRKSAFVVTAVMAGVSAVSTAVLTGLLIRKRRQRDALAALRERHFQLGAAPRREGGVMVMGGLRF